MKIGITGTRFALTEYQLENLKEFLGGLVCGMTENTHELHHGDCVGADATVASIADSYMYRIVSHPPINDDFRAFFESGHPFNETRQPTTYFARNRNIVDECDLLLVVPFGMIHLNSGGTWYTHDYAVKKKCPIKIFWPEEPEGIL